MDLLHNEAPHTWDVLTLPALASAVRVRPSPPPAG